MKHAATGQHRAQQRAWVSRLTVRDVGQLQRSLAELHACFFGANGVVACCEHWRAAGLYLKMR